MWCSLNTPPSHCREQAGSGNDKPAVRRTDMTLEGWHLQPQVIVWCPQAGPQGRPGASGPLTWQVERWGRCRRTLSNSRRKSTASQCSGTGDSSQHLELPRSKHGQSHSQTCTLKSVHITCCQNMPSKQRRCGLQWGHLKAREDQRGHKVAEGAECAQSAEPSYPRPGGGGAAPCPPVPCVCLRAGLGVLPGLGAVTSQCLR